MSARSFCTVTASTKRNSTVAGNKKGAATTYLSSILITPLWPVGNETIRALDLNSPREMKEAYHCPLPGDELPDIRERDILVVDGEEFPVDFAGEWQDNDIPCLHIVVSQVKAS